MPKAHPGAKGPFLGPSFSPLRTTLFTSSVFFLFPSRLSPSLPASLPVPLAHLAIFPFVAVYSFSSLALEREGEMHEEAGNDEELDIHAIEKHIAAIDDIHGANFGGNGKNDQ